MENVHMRHFIIAGIFVLSSILLADNAKGSDIIVLDPGHGGYDMGIVEGDSREKDIALALAREVKAILLTVDRYTSLTRKIDTYRPISERRSNANREEPRLFISIHLSDGPHFTVYTAWYDKPYSDLSIKEFYSIESRQRRYQFESDRLAGNLASVFREQFEGLPVYQRKMPLPLVSSIGAPSVLVEIPSLGIDHEKELFRLASSIVLSILRYERGK
jgi:N-acetylmuramoyl-L-alanine amidase